MGTKHLRKGYTSKRTWVKTLTSNRNSSKPFTERAGCSASNPIGVDESKVTSQFALIWAHSLCLRAPEQASSQA